MSKNINILTIKNFIPDHIFRLSGYLHKINFKKTEEVFSEISNEYNDLLNDYTEFSHLDEIDKFVLSSKHHNCVRLRLSTQLQVELCEISLKYSKRSVIKYPLQVASSIVLLIISTHVLKGVSPLFFSFTTGLFRGVIIAQSIFSFKAINHHAHNVETFNKFSALDRDAKELVLKFSTLFSKTS